MQFLLIELYQIKTSETECSRLLEVREEDSFGSSKMMIMIKSGERWLMIILRLSFSSYTRLAKSNLIPANRFSYLNYKDK